MWTQNEEQQRQGERERERERELKGKKWKGRKEIQMQRNNARMTAGGKKCGNRERKFRE